MNDQRRGRGRGRGRGKFPDNDNQSFGRGRGGERFYDKGNQSLGQERLRQDSFTPSTRPIRPNNERDFVTEERKSSSEEPSPGNANWKNTDGRPQYSANQLHSTSSLGSKKLEFAPHPGYGTAGHPIGLVSNYFSLICKASKVYHYDVGVVCLDKKEKESRNYKKHEEELSDIEKQQKSNVSRKERQEVLSQLLMSKDFARFELQKSMPIYDGCSNIFTSSPLPQELMSLLGEYPFKAEVNDKTRRYVIHLEKVKKKDGSNIINLDVLKNFRKLDLNDLSSDVLLALNAIMQHRGPASSEIRVGRSFFSVSQANKTSIGEGLEIWRGYNQTIHLTDSGPVMISNLSARIFHKSGPAINYINELLDRDIRDNGRLQGFEIAKITQALKGVKVYATHSKYRRKYTINDDNKRETVSRFPANELTMVIGNEQISNAEYFRRNYTPLKFPYLHCFRMRTTTNTFIPFENCEIVENQPRVARYDEHNLPPKLASRMIRETAVPPVRRFQEIEKHVNEVGKECKLQMGNFGLSLNMKPKRIEGRLIGPPTINYKNFPRSQPNECGTWMMKGHFIKALRVESWCVLNFDRRCMERDLARFSEKLAAVAYSYGLVLSKDYEIVPDAQLNSLDRFRNSELVVIILPRDRNNYDQVKLKADCELRLVSQCILSDVLRNVLTKNDNRTVTNICLKINVKLGGVNHQLASSKMDFGLRIFFPQPVIVFGADAVHSLNFPSISSVVGSLDAYPWKYKVCCRVQENPKGRKSQELILHLQSMVEIILREFKVCTENKHPEKIIFFRDGVSEGQFNAILQDEVLAIQKASKEVFGFLINITFIIVQKRHQTRLKPENPKQAAGREGNIPAGTVVDKDITYPNAFDYFLCSHEGIKGTSKPARYTVLYDDNKFSADELQSLTFHLCHTFARCNRSVSIPAPVKYADLAAYRAKKYADLDYINWKNSRQPNHSKFYQMSKYVKEAINNMHENKNGMFFI